MGKCQSILVHSGQTICFTVVQADGQVPTRDCQGSSRSLGEESRRACRRQARHTHQATTGRSLGHQHCLLAGRTEKGPAGRHRSRCRPNRDGPVLASIVQEDGRAILHRLGQVVRRKTSTTLALTSVNSEDKTSLSKLVDVCKTNFNERYEELRRHTGGGILGSKSQAKITKLEKIKACELQQKIGAV